jgi:class 3 adenylate cyclase/pimeloyl-ACP methyl ester carboxylesterase
MEPRIQYAKTSDGVSIAYWTLGEGNPLVYLHWLPVFTHVAMEYRNPDFRRFYELLARTTKLVRFDTRGTGLSDRSVRIGSPEQQEIDISAVADHLGFAKFVLFGNARNSTLAVAYAAHNPERVSHLVLLDPFLRAADWGDSPSFRGVTALLDEDWELFTETFGSVLVGWSSGESARQVAAFLRQCVTAEMAKALMNPNLSTDVTPLLVTLHMPTLVLQNQRLPFARSDAPSSIAAAIPGARLVLLDGRWLGESMDAIAGAIGEFLDHGEGSATGTGLARGTAIILFADIADSTALTERLGDAAFRAKARELGTALRPLVRQCGGTPVEGPTLGDGVLAVFTSAREAIEAAQRCGKAGDDAGLPLHLGLHAGDVTRERDPDGRDNVYGGAVNIAARVSGLSTPGEVLVSETVRSLARTSAGVRFEDRGEQALKGVGEPVRVWAVREGGE